MRTNIDLDEEIVDEAMLLTNSKTKKEVVTLALKELIRKMKKQELAQLWGSNVWEGDLSKMRESSYEKFSL